MHSKLQISVQDNANDVDVDTDVLNKKIVKLKMLKLLMMLKYDAQYWNSQKINSRTEEHNDRWE